jgi:hypothetical protein
MCNMRIYGDDVMSDLPIDSSVPSTLEEGSSAWACEQGILYGKYVGRRIWMDTSYIFYDPVSHVWRTSWDGGSCSGPSERYKPCNSPWEVRIPPASAEKKSTVYGLLRQRMEAGSLLRQHDRRERASSAGNDPSKTPLFNMIVSKIKSGSLGNFGVGNPIEKVLDFVVPYIEKDVESLVSNAIELCKRGATSPHPSISPPPNNLNELSRPFIYITGPGYAETENGSRSNHFLTARNLQHMEDVGYVVLASKGFPLIPQLAFGRFTNGRSKKEILWSQARLSLLGSAQALATTVGWQHDEYAQLEVRAATERGLPIFHDITGLDCTSTVLMADWIADWSSRFQG